MARTFDVQAGGQLPGTTTNDSAAAGNAGELISAVANNSTATITVTIATPAVVTWTTHGFSTTMPTPVTFTNSGGALPTGITAGTTYYTIPSTVTTSTFQIATSIANAIAGTAVATSGTQSGTQTGTNSATLSNNVVKDVLAVVLTPGDWDVTGNLIYAAAGSTVVSSAYSVLSTTTGTLPSPPNTGAYANWLGTFTGAATLALPCGKQQVQVAAGATATIFLQALSGFSTAAETVYGFLGARRVR